MASHANEPDEAMGPQIDGLEKFGEFLNMPAPLTDVAWDDAENGEAADARPEPEAEPPVALLCGWNNVSAAVADLASGCGFRIELVLAEEVSYENIPAEVATVRVASDFANLVETCEIGREHFICVFVEEPDECENILRQCLASDAAYLGAYSAAGTKKEIFRRLREGGVPEAELAPVCCPIGLNIGADTSRQEAVAIVAQLLAVKNGKLKRLHYGE